MNLGEIFSKLNGRVPKLTGSDSYRSYGILIPLTIINKELHLVFEVRSLELRSQPGDICFPGGRVDPSDPNPYEAAIRETSEELGILKQHIEHVHPLDYIIQPVEGRMIYPFVGFINQPEKINPNPDEVKEIFTVPLNYLLNTNPEEYHIHFKVMPEEKFPLHLIPGGENYGWKTRSITEYFYFYKDYVIWGLTANILRNFIATIK